MAEKQIKTFEKKINNETSSANGSFKTLGMHGFACEEDARRAAERWESKQKWCKLDTLNLVVKEN
jgi:transposase